MTLTTDIFGPLDAWSYVRHVTLRIQTANWVNNEPRRQRASVAPQMLNEIVGLILLHGLGRKLLGMYGRVRGQRRLRTEARVNVGYQSTQTATART